MIIFILQIFLSIYLMWKVSSSFDLAANYLTRNLGEGIKGPTVNAIASSLPELMISSLFLFFYKDIDGFSAGYATIIGSSAFNIAVIPVLAYIFSYKQNKIKSFVIDQKIVKQDGFFLLFSIVLLGLGFFIGLNIFYALLLIITYLFYIIFIYKKRNKNPGKKTEIEVFRDKFKNGKNYNYIKSIFNLRIYNILKSKTINSYNSVLVIIISVIIISLACYNLVYVVEKMSEMLGVNLFISAFFIAAISSSIPDTILSLKDAEHKKFNDSFSNTYGSNIFDICIGIGLPVLLYTIFYPPISVDVNIDTLGLYNLGDYFMGGNLMLWSVFILLIFTLLITLVYSSGKISNKNIPILLIIYFLYILGLLIF